MHFSTSSSPERYSIQNNRMLQTYLLLFIIFWISTLIGTTDLINWIIENTLVIFFLAVLIFSHQRFKFSDVTYTFIFIYLSLHIYRAMYT
jgi:putative membrane protein